MQSYTSLLSRLLLVLLISSTNVHANQEAFVTEFKKKSPELSEISPTAGTAAWFLGVMSSAGLTWSVDRIIKEMQAKEEEPVLDESGQPITPIQPQEKFLVRAMKPLLGGFFSSIGLASAFIIMVLQAKSEANCSEDIRRLQEILDSQ